MTGRRHLDANSVGPEKLSASVRHGRYFFETFMMEPFCFKKGSIVSPGGTSLDQCIVDTGRNRFEYTFLGDATDTWLPLLASDGGYNWVLTTGTLDRGVEIIFGGLKDAHPRNFIAGGTASEDWFFRALLITENASGADIFVGFRKVAAPVLTLTEYSDVIGLRILGDSSSTAGAISIVKNLNNAGSTDYTSTAISSLGLEDATAIELEVRAVGGRARYFVNGRERFETTAYAFDSGDVMVPVIRLIQTTDLATQLKTLAAEGGPLADRQDGTLLSLAGSTI